MFKIFTCLDIYGKPDQTQTRNLRVYEQNRKIFSLYFLDALILS